MTDEAYAYTPRSRRLSSQFLRSPAVFPVCLTALTVLALMAVALPRASEGQAGSCINRAGYIECDEPASAASLPPEDGVSGRSPASATARPRLFAEPTERSEEGQKI